MGFDYNGIKLLLNSKKEGVDFTKSVTLGRQEIHVSPKELFKLFKGFGVQKDLDSEPIIKMNDYCESFLRCLGSQITDSIDASEYENATIIHDLNSPIASDLKGKYSVVIDGGTLEHVFNFPIAIKNSMDLIELNGYYIGMSPTNNFFGHGFYQFSPELYFRIFSESNGFKIHRMFFYTSEKNSKVFEVSDPASVKSRVNLANSVPSYLFVLAKKISNEDVFKIIPQQSDYINISWEKQYLPSQYSKLKGIIRLIFPDGTWANLLIRKLRWMSNNIKSSFSVTGTGEKKFFNKFNI